MQVQHDPSGSPIADESYDGVPSTTTEKPKRKRRKEIIYINDKSKRNVCFQKRKKGILKKAQELCILTGCSMFCVIASDDDMYTFSTSKLKPILTEDHCRHTVEECLALPPDFLKQIVESAAAHGSKLPQHQQGEDFDEDDEDLDSLGSMQFHVKISAKSRGNAGADSKQKARKASFVSFKSSLQENKKQRLSDPHHSEPPSQSMNTPPKQHINIQQQPQPPMQQSYSNTSQRPYPVNEIKTEMFDAQPLPNEYTTNSQMTSAHQPPMSNSPYSAPGAFSLQRIMQQPPHSYNPTQSMKPTTTHQQSKPAEYQQNSYQYYPQTSSSSYTQQEPAPQYQPPAPAPAPASSLPFNVADTQQLIDNLLKQEREAGNHSLEGHLLHLQQQIQQQQSALQQLSMTMQNTQTPTNSQDLATLINTSLSTSNLLQQLQHSLFTAADGGTPGPFEKSQQRR